MYDLFAPSIIDYLSLDMSYTLTTDVANSYFHVDEGEECHVSGWDSRPHWRFRPLCFGDCQNSCMAGDALEHAG